MLTFRPRGKNGIFYIRGQVSLGDKRIDVKEFSSGTSDKDAASHLMAEYETKLRHQLMFGPTAAVANGVMADAFASYLSKAKSPHPSDILRISILNQHIGDLSLNDPKQTWEVFRVAYLSKHQPAGQDRYRAVLQAAINVHRDLHDLDMIKIKPIKFNNERVPWLEKDERDRLIASYVTHVRPIATMLAFHGPRCQDALQIQWGTKGVDMKREAIRFYHDKTETVSNVPMHERVKEVLLPIWEDRGRPKSGRVLLNRLGEPYQDTRLAPIPGGNPLKSAHSTACERAEIDDFTVHDWRHHWASHCVMAGIDLITIMKMGGWKSLRMVQRYASVGVEHMRASINKLT
jgi:integrase